MPTIDETALESFKEIQERDHLPCPDTGISHCPDCHGCFPDGPLCGHWIGCPEC